MDKLTAWLLAGPPWVQYRTQLDLLGCTVDDPQVLAARQAMLNHQQIRLLLAELSEWPGTILKRHNDASHLLHKLTFIANLGLRTNDPGMKQIINRILAHQAKEGPFQVLSNIHRHFGGTGEDEWVWMLCDAPLILYALCKFGFKEDDRVRTAAKYLIELIRENGWPCAVAPELGKFRGPGRKTDPCPYATLVMLKVLFQIPDYRDSSACYTGAETLLNLWKNRKMQRPYLFAMGTNFTKLKAPLIWYDILHVLDVLTEFPWLRKDTRVLEMIEIVKTKADEQGYFSAESIWRAWKEWEFGQKRNPSRWITFLVQRILSRINA